MKIRKDILGFFLWMVCTSEPIALPYFTYKIISSVFRTRLKRLDSAPFTAKNDMKPLNQINVFKQGCLNHRNSVLCCCLRQLKPNRQTQFSRNLETSFRGIKEF